MSYQPSPLWSVQDSAGAPRLGAKLKFYQAGTSTPKAVYSDSDRTASLGAVLTVDGNGNYDGLIYLATDGDYKVVFTDSADNELYSFDNISAAGSSGGSVFRSSRATCPLDYGAIGDGAADESADVQSAIDDATGDVDLAGKTYRCDSAITLKSGIRIYNGTLDFTNCTAAECITGTGSVGSQLLLTANGSVLDTSISLSSGDAATLAAGDWLQLRTSQEWEDASNVVEGEWVRVKSVSGTTINLTAPLLGDYETANGANAKKLTSVKNVTIQDVRIVGQTQASAQQGIKLTLCEDVSLVRVRVTGIDGNGIWFHSSINPTAVDCHVRNVGSTNSIGYGISNGCLNPTLSWCKANGVTYGATYGTGGSAAGHVDRHVNISKCQFHGCTYYGINGQPGAQHATIEGCTVIGTSASTTGILAQGADVVMRGNFVRFVQTAIYVDALREIDYATGASKDPDSKSDRNTFLIQGNDIRHAGYIGIWVDANASSLDIDGVSIAGNVVSGCDLYGIFVNAGAGTADMTRVNVTGNVVMDTDATGIFVFAASSRTIDGLVVSVNHCSGMATAADCIRVESDAISSVKNVVVSGNECSGGSVGIYLEDCEGVVCEDNVITGTAQEGIYYISDAGSGGTVRGIYIGANRINAAGDNGIEVYADTNNIADVQIVGANINTPTGHGVYIHADTSLAITRVSVSNVIVRNPGASKYGVYGVATTVSGISGIDINACSVVAGDVGIYVDKATDVRISQCRLSSQAVDSLGYGIYVLDSSYVRILDNIVFSQAGDCIRYAVSGGASKTQVTIARNDIALPAANGIRVQVGGTMTYLSVAGNTVNSEVASSCIHVEALGSAGPTNASITGLVVSGNNVVAGHASNDGIALVSETATGSGTIQNINVHTNTVHCNGSGQGTVLSGDGTFDHGSVHGNTYFGGTNVVEQTAAGTFTDMHAAGNFFYGYSTDAVVGAGWAYSAESVDGAGIDGNDSTMPNFKDA